ncbi:MAG: thiamine pyrophosphate-binding protein [Candidatus Pacebacteria bacterium]|nr:thiamine pyrophosphate-binding protein [Candidatus Paceibacterota bacterium]
MKQKITKKLCSEIIVDFLVSKKINHVFDLSGGMITYLEDAISRKKGIECVPMHHEQAAGFAAEGYARKNKNFGVAIATSGPGATNLITAIGSSYFDSIPTMFIVGQVHTNNLKKNDKVRQEGFQETDIVSVVKTLTKYAVLIKNEDDLVYELEKAYFIMKNGRTGSVLIDIPINIQRSEVDINKIKHFVGSSEHKKMLKVNESLQKRISIKNIEKLKKFLQTSKSPLVLVGNGISLSSTEKKLYDFVINNNLPVVSSLLGLDSFPFSKNFVGYIGANGNRDANIIFANADLIIVLGSRLDIRQTGEPKFFNKKATIIHVDIDDSSLNYSIQSHISLKTDLVTFFNDVKDICTPRKVSWFSFIEEVKKNFSRTLSYITPSIDPHTFLYELSSYVSSDATIVADVGQNQMWLAQSWNVKKGQRLLFCAGMGAMGFSLPASIGAWYASQKSQIISICGDGGIQINIQELETVKRNNIPLKIFIFNNKSLGMVREFQDLYFNKNYQSTIKGYGYPDFKKIAHAYDFEYVVVDSIKENDIVIKEIVNSKNPVLVEVVLDIFTPLYPKVVYGHALDDQSPYLDEKQKDILETLKKALENS